MSSRISMKVTGAQGQGVNSVGEMCGKGLKREGYCVHGYREYMSLIKGGHSSYQLDVSSAKVGSSETTVDILANFNHHGLENNWQDVKPGGIVLHQSPDWEWPADQAAWLKQNNVTVVCLPTEEILTQLKAPAILGNVLITAVVWTLFGESDAVLKELVREQFGHKGEELVQKNFAAIDAGVKFVEETEGLEPVTLPEADKQWTDCMYLTGAAAMGMGMVHGGCRMYVGYPMTPSTPVLSYMADHQNELGLVIKQAEDEITAAQMMSGAMAMGTRAATGTSGGGFDLMTETVSLNGLIENPSVIILAQRPGPATGLPTWTAQGDLLLAVGSAHGEFPRLVMSVADGEDNFYLMPEAFNYAEDWQIPVIVLTEKEITERLYTQPQYDLEKVEISRGKLITDSKELMKLKESDRYDPTAEKGVSARWLPGSEASATHVYQGDEHDSEGNVDESAENAIEQMEKRMRKMTELKASLPDPILYECSSAPTLQRSNDTPELDLLIVSWGSNKSTVEDVMTGLADARPDISIGYLHYSYLWPLKTGRLEALAAKAKKTVLIEQNYQGQLGMLIRMECGLKFDEQLLKFDGRPFFYDELLEKISHCIS